MDYGLDYVRGDGVKLVSYTNLDWAGCVVDKKALQGVVLVWVGKLCHGLVRNIN